jgi:hypothetical protein
MTSWPAYRLAVETARAHCRDFLIVLSVDGSELTDLDALDVTVLRFDDRWSAGLSALLEKLGSLGAPRPVTDGPEIAAEARRFLASKRSWHTVL